MLNEENKTYYVLTVNGKTISDRHESLTLAEMAKINLPEDQQKLAEITQVAENGQQILRG